MVPCPECGQVFKRGTSMDNHRRRMHPAKAGPDPEPRGEMVRVKCPKCDRQYPSFDLLERHVESDHPEAA
jgi:uncharacterized C2H2 Zn-finger protein